MVDRLIMREKVEEIIALGGSADAATVELDRMNMTSVSLSSISKLHSTNRAIYSDLTNRCRPAK